MLLFHTHTHTRPMKNDFITQTRPYFFSHLFFPLLTLTKSSLESLRTPLLNFPTAGSRDLILSFQRPLPLHIEKTDNGEQQHVTVM